LSLENNIHTAFNTAESAITTLSSLPTKEEAIAVLNAMREAALTAVKAAQSDKIIVDRIEFLEGEVSKLKEQLSSPDKVSNKICSGISCDKKDSCIYYSLLGDAYYYDESVQRSKGILGCHGFVSKLKPPTTKSTSHNQQPPEEE